MTSRYPRLNLEFGVCCSPGEAATLPPDAYDYIEANVQHFLVPEKSEAEFAANLEASHAIAKPMKAACCFLPGDLKCVGPNIDETRLTKYAENVFQRAGKAGMTMIVFGSGVARTAPEGYPIEKAMDDFVGVLKKIAPLAEPHGVTIVVEPLNRTECNVITTLEQGAEAVTRCDHPSVRLLADYFHMLKDGEPATEVVKYGSLIKHTHISELKERACPGTYNEDFTPFFDALNQVGYTGGLSLECIWKDLNTEFGPAMVSLREQLTMI